MEEFDKLEEKINKIDDKIESFDMNAVGMIQDLKKQVKTWRNIALVLGGVLLAFLLFGAEITVGGGEFDYSTTTTTQETTANDDGTAFIVNGEGDVIGNSETNNYSHEPDTETPSD